MSHTEGKLFVMDLREVGAEELTITNGQDKRSIVCRIENKNSKRPLDDNDVANARRLVACWNALLPCGTEMIERFDQAGIDNVYTEIAKLKQERDELKTKVELLERQLSLLLDDKQHPAHRADMMTWIKSIRRTK